MDAMVESTRDVVVLGAGVIGLTSARRLQRAGHRVRVVAEEVGLETTSARAAAVWLPFKAEPRRRIGEWAHHTYRVCRELAGVEGAGVRFVPLRRLSRRPLEEPFWLRPGIPFRHLEAAELPDGYRHGWEAEVPFLHARRFLAWLLDGFRAAGGEVVRRRVGSLDEAAEVGGLGPEGVVVHCAGLGARQTVGDDTMFPIRGQLVVVRPGAPVGHRVDDDEDAAPAYVLPRSEDEVILGGTAQAGDARGEADAAEEAAILERCRRLLAPLAGGGGEGDGGEPREGDPLDGLEIIDSVVGLRPGRPEVRLEVEPAAAAGRPVVHNYGHGGSGFTVCWGCAEEVAQRVGKL